MSESKVIVITGASRGIGAELLRGFARKGLKVVLNYSKSDETADALFADIALFTKDILKVKADVSDRHEVRRMFDQVVERFGKIDILINNAGQNIDGPFIQMSDAQWQRVLGVHLTGTFICSQEFVLHSQGNDGHIVNVSASTALKGRKNGANYCSAKAGIIALTKCLALELAPKIKVNCVVPGFMETEEVLTRYGLYDKDNHEKAISAIPLMRLGTPSDVFALVDFIVNESTYITGQNFFVNGGNYLG